MIPTTHDPGLMIRMRNRPALDRFRDANGQRWERIISVYVDTDMESGVIRWCVGLMEASEDRLAWGDNWSVYSMRDWPLALEDGATLAAHYKLCLRFATTADGWVLADPADVTKHPAKYHLLVR